MSDIMTASPHCEHCRREGGCPLEADGGRHRISCADCLRQGQSSFSTGGQIRKQQQAPNTCADCDTVSVNRVRYLLLPGEGMVPRCNDCGEKAREAWLREQRERKMQDKED